MDTINLISGTLDATQVQERAGQGKQSSKREKAATLHFGRSRTCPGFALVSQRFFALLGKNLGLYSTQIKRWQRDPSPFKGEEQQELLFPAIQAKRPAAILGCRPALDLQSGPCFRQEKYTTRRPDFRPGRHQRAVCLRQNICLGELKTLAKN